MKIKTVTITGADDKTNHLDLIKISERFPFVEWGILFSPKKKSGPRYPSEGWVNQIKTSSRGLNMNFSAHLCGGYTREFLETGLLTQAIADMKDNMMSNFFGRHQMNFNSSRHVVCEAFFESLGRTSTKVILQYNKSNFGLCQEVYCKCGYNTNIHFLYDGSGGRGVLPEKWSAVMPNHFTGYAGGLSPENLNEALVNINLAVGDNEIWIDTETGVRANDRLDLDKVFKFLEITERYTK